MVHSVITLYPPGETEFTTNGLGSLSEATNCVVKEEANGSFELEMVYPVWGRRYNDLKNRSIIFCKPNPVDPPQAFRVYQITKPINGLATYYASHISYDLSGYPVSPFSAAGCVNALTLLKSHAMVEHPFEFWTDKSTSGNFTLIAPASTRSLLGGVEGSILDIYKGDYKFDNFLVRLYEKRGTDRGVVIRYGKNLTDLNQEEKISGMYTAVLPFYYREDEELGPILVTGDIVACEGTYDFDNILVRDFSSDFTDTQPTIEQLNEQAKQYINDNKIGEPDVSLTVSFAQLEQTLEYQDLALLERVELFDTVTVEFPEMNVSSKTDVQATEYDVLTNRYNSITLGTIKASIQDTIASQETDLSDQVNQKVDNLRSDLQKAVDNATKWITNGKGYMVAITDEAGNWTELCSLDTMDIETAVNVWRWNNGGFGHSSNGYNGPYTTAITQEGEIVADFITAGILRANLIQAGILSSKDGEAFYLDIENSILKMKATELSISGKTIPEYMSEASLDYTSFIVSLNNEYQGVPVNSDGSYSGSLSISIQASAYYGSENVTSNASFSTSKSTSVTGSWSPTTHTYTVTGLSADEGYVDISATYSATSATGMTKNLSSTKRFVVKKVRDGDPGADARNYFLELSATALKRTGSGIVPSSITAYAYYRDGTSTSRSAYAGRIRFQTTTNGTSFVNVSSSTSNETSRTYSMTSLSTSVIAIRVILYAAGGLTSTLAMVTIPIIADASSMTQKEVFDILTNNGQEQGIYLRNGKIYINLEYLVSSTIASADGYTTWDLTDGRFHSGKSGGGYVELYGSLLSGGTSAGQGGYMTFSTVTTYPSGERITTTLNSEYGMSISAQQGIHLRSFSQDGISIERICNGKDSGVLEVVGSIDGLNNYGYINYIYLASGFVGFCDYYGTVVFATTTSSDARLKRDFVETTEKALDVINAIGHCSFTYKANGKKNRCGYIAQQLQEVREEFVMPAKNGDGSYTLHVNDYAILQYATKAIQELSEENARLTQRCDDLEKRIGRLEDLVSTLVNSK